MPRSMAESRLQVGRFDYQRLALLLVPYCPTVLLPKPRPGRRVLGVLLLLHVLADKQRR